MILLRSLRAIQIKVNRLCAGRFHIPAFSERYSHEVRRVNLLTAESIRIGDRRGVGKTGDRHSKRRIFTVNIIAPPVINSNAGLEGCCTLPHQSPTQTHLVPQAIVAVVLTSSQGKAAINPPVPLRLIFSEANTQGQSEQKYGFQLNLCEARCTAGSFGRQHRANVACCA